MHISIIFAGLFLVSSVQCLRIPSRAQRANTGLHMAVYSPAKGILAQITEERDACGVGFISSLTNTPSHSVVKQVAHATRCTHTLPLNLRRRPLTLARAWSTEERPRRTTYPGTEPACSQQCALLFPPLFPAVNPALCAQPLEALLGPLRPQGEHKRRRLDGLRRRDVFYAEQPGAPG